jgi:hypothetical protein
MICEPSLMNVACGEAQKRHRGFCSRRGGSWFLPHACPAEISKNIRKTITCLLGLVFSERHDSVIDGHASRVDAVNCAYFMARAFKDYQRCLLVKGHVKGLGQLLKRYATQADALFFGAE